MIKFESFVDKSSEIWSICPIILSSEIDLLYFYLVYIFRLSNEIISFDISFWKCTQLS